MMNFEKKTGIEIKLLGLAISILAVFCVYHFSSIT